MIFENTQPPIIEESVFLIVQNIRKARRRPTKMGEMGMFSGLLYCAECGGKMYQCRATNFAENQKYFICSTYRKGKDLCTTHSIKNVVLHEMVLRNLREAISYVSEHKAEFIQDAAESDMQDRDAEFVRKRETLAKADAAVLRAFIDRIEVSHADKKSRTREITIVYNFIGAFDFTRAIENARNTSKKEQRTA